MLVCECMYASIDGTFNWESVNDKKIKSQSTGHLKGPIARRLYDHAELSKIKPFKFVLLPLFHFLI